MDRGELTMLVLTELARRIEEIRRRKRPDAWKWWEVEADDADRRYGPRYSPTWFGEVGTTEAGRVRLLRTIYRLAQAGLLAVVKSEGGRLVRLKLTRAGRDGINKLQKAVAPSADNVTEERAG